MVTSRFSTYLILFVVALVFTQALLSKVSNIFFWFIFLLPFVLLVYTLIARASLSVSMLCETVTTEKNTPYTYEFLIENNISFAALHDQQIDFVVARVEMSYKYPLRSGDTFVSELDFRQEGIKYVFIQKIYRLPDRKLCNVGRFDCVCLDHGKLKHCELLDDFIKKITAEK